MCYIFKVNILLIGNPPNMRKKKSQNTPFLWYSQRRPHKKSAKEEKDTKKRKKGVFVRILCVNFTIR